MREYFSPRWTCVVGNCDVDWLRHPEYTPEAVFGEMIEIGFHSSADLINGDAPRRPARRDRRPRRR